MSTTVRTSDLHSYYGHNPSDFVSMSEKRTKTWFMPKAAYLKSKCMASNPDIESLSTLYKAANGEIDTTDYDYVTNPFNSDNPKLKQFPAKLRHHDIISPIVYRFIGEYIKSSFRFSVGINNEDVDAKRKKEEDDLVRKITDIMIAASVGKIVNNEEAPKEEQSLADVVKEFNETWSDNRVVQAEDVLEYLNDRYTFDYKYWSAYVDWIIAGRYISYKDVRFDDIHFEIINPKEFYPVLNGTEFVEDIDECMRVYNMPLTYIVSNFRNKLTVEDIKYIEEMVKLYKNDSVNISVTDGFYALYNGDVIDNIASRYGSSFNIPMNNGYIDITHYVWKSFKKIQILSYTDNLGQVQEVEVSDDYVIDPMRNEIIMRVEYVDEFLEMYQFGNEQFGVFTKPEAVTVQRNELNNTSIVKNPYGGKMFLFNGLFNPSVVKPLLPYQIIYNVIHFHRETAIANNIGKVLIIPKGVLVDDDEITQAEAVYYIKADKKLYVNEQADGFNAAISALRSVDANDSEYIIGLGEILRSIKEEAWDLVGMNRQRYGDTMASDGKATTEQAIYRASIGTASLVEVFNLARIKDYEAIIDFCKFAWLEDSDMRPMGGYKNSDGRIKYLNINPRMFAETSYGLYVTNNTKEEDKLRAYKELAFSAQQNGAFELGIEAIEETNATKLKNVLKAWRKIEDDRASQQAQAQQESQQAALQKQQETQMAVLQATLQNNIDVRKVDAEGRIAQAEIYAAAQLDAKTIDSTSKAETSKLKENTEKYKADTQKDIAKIKSVINNRK